MNRLHILLACVLTCAFLTDSYAATPKEEIASGQRSFSNRKFDEARLHFANALALTPSKMEKFSAELFTGLSYMSEGKSDLAIVSLEKIVNDNTISESDKITVRSLLAASYDASRQFSKSREQSLYVLKNGSPESRMLAQFAMARSFFAEGLYSSSIDESNKYLALPNLDETNILAIKLLIGTAYFRMGDYPSAIKQLQEITTTQISEIPLADRRQVIQVIQQANFTLASLYISQASIRYEQALQMDYPLPVYAVASKRSLDDLQSLLQKNDQEIKEGGMSSNVGLQIDSAGSKSKPTGDPGVELKVGQVAPEFAATDASGREFKLSDFRGKKKVLLTFFPKCFTGGCTNHLSSLQEHKPEFDANNVEVVAISVDPAEGEQGQLAFAKMWGFKFRFIPDTNRKISLLYGAARQPDDLSSRMSIVVDESGIIQVVDTDVHVMTHGADMLARMRELGLIK